jgi:predicted Rossmann fold flavoprotein
MAEGVFDIVVVGAGAAGLLAATQAAEGGRSVLLLEKNRKPGVKILMSGGTRCNITHATDNRGIVEAFGPSGRCLHSALAALSVEQTIDLFEREGVATKVEETGKVFPVSNKAADVLAALLRRLDRSGARLALAEPAQEVVREGGLLKVKTPLRLLEARRLILTSGGKSYPGSGTTGDGYTFAAALGHTIVPPRPALTPIKVGAAWVAALRGITVPDVVLGLFENGKCLGRRRGSLLLAHFGLSGPVALDLSREVTAISRPDSLSLEIDWLPDLPADMVEDRLRLQSISSGKKQLAAIMHETLPHRLCEALVALAGLPVERRAAALSRQDRLQLVRLIKSTSLAVAGTLGFEKAEVTAGGIPLNEVDFRTMQSKLVPELYLAGEILDLDGPIGGFNFQAAFSTGFLAGRAAAASLAAGPSSVVNGP